MTRKMIVTEKGITTGVAKNKTIVTDTVTNLETNLETILDPVTKVLTNLKFENRVMETNEISAGSTAVYVRKRDIAGY